MASLGLFKAFFFSYTQGGESTAEEMCLNFLFYYPRMENITQYCTSLQYNPVKGFINKFLYVQRETMQLVTNDFS